MEQPLINRVANSGLITLKLEEFFPQEEVMHFDLKDYLFMEMILKVPEAVTGDRVILKQMWVFQSLRFSRLID